MADGVDLHYVLLEKLGYGKLLPIRRFKNWRLFITLICLLLLVLYAQSCATALQIHRSGMSLLCCHYITGVKDY